MWFGYTDNTLFLVGSPTNRSFSKLDGLNIGAVTAILPGRPTYVGGELGLSVFDGSRFLQLHADREEVLSGITGLLKAKDGSLWLNGNSGIGRIDPAELNQSLADGNHRLRIRVFDAEDGMPGSAQEVRPLPTAVQSSDGKLWFAGSEGVAWLDPDHLRLNRLAPNTVIESLESGSSTYLPSDALRLEAGTSRVKIHYTALSLSIPARVRFKTRLQDIDADWQDMAGARVVTYSNLSPGSYSFEVIGSNDAGLWSQHSASLRFYVAPLIYQTLWFRTLDPAGCNSLMGALPHAITLNECANRNANERACR